ncbi:putative oxidoreductase [Helianthus annuus]|nr:putative oxidoreductase [Helianthus annuus]
MEFSFTTFLVFSLFVFLLSKLFTPSKPKQNLPPEPWRLPIIGHMHHLIGSLPHRGLRDLALKYGPLMHLQLGELSTIVISDPRWAKEVLTTHDIAFADRPVVLTTEIVAYQNTDVVWSPYGDYWRQLRKIVTLELLSVKKVKSFSYIREDECYNLVKTLRGSAGSPVNLSQMIFDTIAKIVCRAAFGKGCKDQEEFIDIVKELFKLTGGFDVADVFPSKKIIHTLTGKRPKLESIHKRLDKILSDVITEHPGQHANTSDQESLLDVLLRLQASGEFKLSTKNVKAVTLDMFGGGTDTSSATLEWAISELIKNPRVLKKAQAELRDALKGKERIVESDLHDLDYLKVIVRETLRMHLPLPLLFPRECREACKIGGYDIPLKTKLLVNGWAINRDPAYWKDPDSFIPERFSDNPTNVLGTEFEYLPFGAGRRMCPAAVLGIANVEVPLAHMLYYFDWELPNNKPGDELDMDEVFGASVQRKNELYLVMKPYNFGKN